MAHQVNLVLVSRRTKHAQCLATEDTNDADSSQTERKGSSFRVWVRAVRVQHVDSILVMVAALMPTIGTCHTLLHKVLWE